MMNFRLPTLSIATCLWHVLVRRPTGPWLQLLMLVRNPQSAIHNPQSDYGRSTNSTRDDGRGRATAHARPTCVAPAQLQLVDRTDLRSGGTTRAALVVGGLRDHIKHCDLRTLLHWLPDFHRRRHMGKSDPGWLGLGHYQFRFLDRYRTCRDADLSHSVFASAKMAYLDQPFRGSDDAVCGDLRGDFPWHSRRSILDGMVPGADP